MSNCEVLKLLRNDGLHILRLAGDDDRASKSFVSYCVAESLEGTVVCFKDSVLFGRSNVGENSPKIAEHAL
jgi:hypothetical protein